MGFQQHVTSTKEQVAAVRRALGARVAEFTDLQIVSIIGFRRTCKGAVSAVRDLLDEPHMPA